MSAVSFPSGTGSSEVQTFCIPLLAQDDLGPSVCVDVIVNSLLPDSVIISCHTVVHHANISAQQLFRCERFLNNMANDGTYKLTTKDGEVLVRFEQRFVLGAKCRDRFIKVAARNGVLRIQAAIFNLIYKKGDSVNGFPEE